MSHLQTLFGTTPHSLVVMLQEVCLESLQALRSNSWVQQNFTLSDSDAPQSIYDTVEGSSFVMKFAYWGSARYFSLMMIPKSFNILECFRVPLQSLMGRDALFADLEVSTSSQERPKQSIRLCTTHLECLFDGRPYRKRQLADISQLLKESLVGNYENIAGVIGGDMNAIEKWDHDIHRTLEVDLKDVWEDEPAPPIPALKPFKKDMSYGRARENTWGYHNRASRNRKRLDKSFYTGRVETVALSEVKDVTGRLRRVGIDLKTEIEGWVNLSMSDGKHETNMAHAIYFSETVGKRLREQYGEEEFNAR